MIKKDSTQTVGNSLIIVESPAKIKTISKFLGSGFKIVSTFGHVKDLPEKTLGVEINQDKIVLDYAPLKGKATVINDICKEAKKVDQVFLASDPDREGEAIAFHIAEEIKKATKNKVIIFRIVFNELTKTVIKQAIENKGEIDYQKVAAQQARRVLDRWVGYEVSPILWKKIAKGSSAGRVQSIAVLFVTEREKEILTFVTEESWTLNALLDHKNYKLEVQLYKIKNKAAALKIEDDVKKVLEKVQEHDFEITDIVDKQRSKNPLPPFITSTLQQDAYNKLGFSVDKTMTIAQKLYEGVSINGAQEALITYMRTDSTRLSETILTDIASYISSTLGKDYLSKKPVVYTSKENAQDAHEAIRPISASRTPEELKGQIEPDFFKLYDLIWRRTLACQMTSAVYAQRQVLLSVAKDYIFKANGSTLIFDGFLKIYKPEEENQEKEDVLPQGIEVGHVLQVKKYLPKQHFTQPPPRYNEATLVKELEKRGIGRPSTYSAIMTNIQNRNYVEKNNKRFFPTELGKAIVNLLVENLQDIFNPSFTAQMEEDLDKIAEGKKDRDIVLLDFYKKFKKDLEKFGTEGDKSKVSKFVQTQINCPKCKKNLLAIRFGKNGEFLACLGFPECNFTSQFEKDQDGNIKIIEKAADKVLEEKCPQCGKNLVEKNGRYGTFAACPGFPSCKFIKNDNPDSANKKTGKYSKFSKKK